MKWILDNLHLTEHEAYTFTAAILQKLNGAKADFTEKIADAFVQNINRTPALVMKQMLMLITVEKMKLILPAKLRLLQPSGTFNSP